MSMYSPPAAQARALPRPDAATVQKMLVGSFGWMFAALLLSSGVAYLVASSPSILLWTLQMWLPIVIVQFVLGFGIQLGIRKLAPTMALLLFFVYAALMGLTIGAIVFAYLKQPGGVQAVASAFFSAAGMFGAAAVYGGVAKRDLSKLGAVAFMALFGIIIASIVNIFLNNGTLGWIISILGVLIFTALTAFDTQKIVRGDFAAWAGGYERGTVFAAMQLYLNFINLFLFLLRIFGNRN